jgi:hypothetical protein
MDVRWFTGFARIKMEPVGAFSQNSGHGGSEAETGLKWEAGGSVIQFFGGAVGGRPPTRRYGVTRRSETTGQLDRRQETGGQAAEPRDESRVAGG